jgi:hypothetical protein
LNKYSIKLFSYKLHATEYWVVFLLQKCCTVTVHDVCFR